MGAATLVLPIETVWALARIMDREDTKYGVKYTLLFIMPMERPGVTSDWDFAPDKTFEIYRVWYTTRDTTPLCPGYRYRVTGYIQGCAKAGKTAGQVFFNPYLVVTALTKIGAVHIPFDPVAYVLSSGTNREIPQMGPGDPAIAITEAAYDE